DRNAGKPWLAPVPPGSVSKKNRVGRPIGMKRANRLGRRGRGRRPVETIRRAENGGGRGGNVTPSVNFHVTDHVSCAYPDWLTRCSGIARRSLAPERAPLPGAVPQRPAQRSGAGSTIISA